MQGSTPNERSPSCGLHGGKECARKLSDAAPAQHFLIFNCLRYCERSCNTPQLVKPLEAKAAGAAPMSCMTGNSVTHFKKQGQPVPPPELPFKKDGPAVNGCFQSIDEEAPNWQELIETLVRIIFSSGTFAPTWCADSANHGARECERTPHPRAVWAASCPASCGDSGRSDAAHPLFPARRVALPPRGRFW